jgi:glycosyltransferase involved in cell wall biosynthesis
MARFVPQKNLSLLIRAFGLVCAQGVSAHLVILGRGDERSSLARLAEKVAPGRITFLDWTEHPTATMKSADIYALSSNYEGWGRVCIEALATGTPLLMTDVGCAGSVIQNGVQAMVVPVGDVARFASSLHILSTNATLRDTLREAGKNTILGLPSIEASIQTYIKTLEACLPSASKPKHLVDQK